MTDTTDGVLPEDDEERDLVLITGMSGAGRTQAIHTFEDLGYFCIDNLPPALLGQLVELAELPGSRIRKVAVVCDVRGGAFFEELIAAIRQLEEQGVKPRILFLTADDRTLVRRFKETRRRHPLAEVGSVASGIAEERNRLKAIEQRADLRIDTTELPPQDLRSLIREAFVAAGHVDQLTVTVSSFGFKYGVPIDADIVMDVRFLPNPYYIQSLRTHTGLDDAVREYVFSKPETGVFLERWLPLVEFLLPNYLTEGKTALHIALGCTGGMHRSVALAEHTAVFARELGYTVTVAHRDIARDKARP
ncbi:MAG: RNase adapter RapZ [Coriobacteriia bacterium]|nr:RNase adapter RapZ [Coriobacteriia bacterium]